jgi:hypothetical protein
VSRGPFGIKVLIFTLVWVLVIHSDCGMEPGRHAEKKRRVTSHKVPVLYGTFESSVIAKRAHARPSTKLRQGMPWLRGEATGLPGL